MSNNNIQEALDRFLQLLDSNLSTTGDFETILAPISSAVNGSVESPEFREKCSTEKTWKQVRSILEKRYLGGADMSLVLRLVRGVVLFGRNISYCNQIIPWQCNIQSSIFENINIVSAYMKLEISNQVVESLLQLLSNITNNALNPLDDFSFVDSISQSILSSDVVECVSRKEIFIPFLMTLNNGFRSSDVLFTLLTSENGEKIVDLLSKEVDKIDVTSNDLPDYQIVLVSIFQKIISHESYFKFLSRTEQRDESKLIILLKISQIVIISKDNWDNYQLTSILAWLYDFFLRFSKISQEILGSKIYEEENLKNIHLKLITSLDCIANLAKFDSAKSFLLHYKAVPELISLLGVIHSNTQQKSLKNKEIDHTKKHFPQVKSLIIEVLTFLIFENFQVQEEVRELHGLELILSNCVIDDNDPFIKERSIICLKFLLKNNMGNQDFVSKLEAKEPVHDDSLKEAGYQVEIVDGKVQLKQTEELKEKQRSIEKTD